MKETSILTKLCSLFDKAAGKVCPVLATDAMTVPATFVQIVGAERGGDGSLKVTFEICHRYRDADPTDAVWAVDYLEKLCLAAEKSGARLCSMSAGGALNTSVGECTARLEYISGDGLTLKIGERDLSDIVLGIKIAEKGGVKAVRYIYGPEVYCRRNPSTLCVTLVCRSGSVSEIMNAFGTSESTMTVAVGTDAFRAVFVLGELTSDGDVCAELYSSGAIEYATLGGGGIV